MRTDERSPEGRFVRKYDPVCLITACELPSRMYGYCVGHYYRVHRGLDLETPLRSRHRTVLDRISSLFVVGDECWEWTGSKNPHGYGKFENRGAHAVVYEILVGPVPPGLELDHKCHSENESCPGGRSCPHRACVRPSHLQPISQEQNILQSRTALAAINARKTECIHGHSFDQENTYYQKRNGHLHRGCRICQRASGQRQREKKRQR